jgi:Fe-S-cluster containining protein
MIKRSTPLKEVLRLGKPCKRCGHCCKYGTGFLVEKDIPRIAKYLKITEEELKTDFLEAVSKFNTTLFRPKMTKKPFGPCIFYENRICTIQDVKPLQCRIGNCSEYGEELSVWFTLNYFVNKHDPESIRQWALYLVSKGKNIPGGKLKELVPHEKTLKKILRYEILN